MTRLAFFLSGTGGNALNLLRACREGRVPAEPVLAIASSPRAAGLAKLEAEGLAGRVIERKAFESDGAFSEACYAACEAEAVDLVCLAGWLKKLGVPKLVLGRMVANTAIDTALGSIPFVGDMFDVAYRSNSKNVALLRRHLEKTHAVTYSRAA